MKYNIPPKEGQLYKTISLGKHHFELRYGYYADFERANSEPVIIYPDLKEQCCFDQYGYRIVTAIQDPCDSYHVHACKKQEECCHDCIHYVEFSEGIGVCMSIQNNQDYHLVGEEA